MESYHFGFPDFPGPIPQGWQAAQPGVEFPRYFGYLPGQCCRGYGYGYCVSVHYSVLPDTHATGRVSYRGAIPGSDKHPGRVSSDSTLR
jgi:hypothetical protein